MDRTQGASQPIDDAEELFLQRLESAEGKDIDLEALCLEFPQHAQPFRRLQADFARADDPKLARALSPGRTWATGLAEGSRISDFRLIRLLGRGGQGEVWRAEQVSLGREVALKILPPLPREGRSTTGSETPHELPLRALPATESLTISSRHSLEEARVLASLDHPNIIKIHQIEDTPERLFICLELVEGETLEQLVNERGPLSAPEAALIGAELCRALAEIHSNGVLHLDIKPSNAMRSSKGRVLLLDFGLSSRSDTPESVPGTASPSPGGTPLFMPPEQDSDCGGVTERSDLYSLGIVLYWLVSGQSPFDAPSRVALRFAVHQGRSTPLLDRCPTVPEKFAAIVERAMQVYPEDRFASAGEMERALREFLHGLTPPLAVPSAKWRVSALAGLAGLAATALWIAGREPEAQPAPSVPPVDVIATFYQEVDGEDLALADKTTLQPGDRIYLHVDAREPLYLYVFNEDSNGNRFRLFPSGPGEVNPNAAGSYRFPLNPSRPECWVLDKSSGSTEEVLLFVACREENLTTAGLLAHFAEPAKRVDDAPKPSAGGDRGVVLEGPASSSEGPSTSWQRWIDPLAPPEGAFVRYLELQVDAAEDK